MAKLIFENTEEEKELQDDSPLAESCEEAGVPFACTEGICGTCIVEITDGIHNLSEPTEAEINFLGDSGIKKERMACQCRIKAGFVKIRF